MDIFADTKVVDKSIQKLRSIFIDYDDWYKNIFYYNLVKEWMGKIKNLIHFQMEKLND